MKQRPATKKFIQVILLGIIISVVILYRLMGVLGEFLIQILTMFVVIIGWQFLLDKVENIT